MSSFRRRLMMAAFAGGGGSDDGIHIPSVFQRVEYIDTDGNQYINTGVIAAATASSELDIMFLVTAGGPFIALSDGTGTYGTNYGQYNGSFSIFSSYTLNAPSDVRTVVSCYIDGGYEYVSAAGDVTAFPYSGSSSPYLLFASAGWMGTAGSVRFWGGKFYDNGVLVRHFIPCYRKSDGKPGLWDMVTWQFFTNANTSAQTDFTVGPDVIQPPTQYIIFVDRAVEAICVANWGDGVGITPAQAAAVTSQQFRGKFKNNTQIVSFEEFQYFTGVTRLFEEDGFYGCLNLASLTLPSLITTLDWSSLALPSLSGTFVIPASVYEIWRGTLDGTTNLTNLVCLAPSLSQIFFVTSGNGTGILYMKNLSNANRYINAHYKHILIDGDLTFTAADNLFQGANVESIRISGDLTASGTEGNIYYDGSGSVAFVELLGQIISGWLVWTGYRSGAIIHLGYSGIAATPSQLRMQDNTNISKVYVGSGESQAADQAVLNQYLADSAWAQYSSKLDLWYNYNGEYKNWPTIPTS